MSEEKQTLISVSLLREPVENHNGTDSGGERPEPTVEPGAARPGEAALLSQGCGRRRNLLAQTRAGVQALVEAQDDPRQEGGRFRPSVRRRLRGAADPVRRDPRSAIEHLGEDSLGSAVQAPDPKAICGP